MQNRAALGPASLACMFLFFLVVETETLTSLLLRCCQSSCLRALGNAIARCGSGAPLPHCSARLAPHFPLRRLQWRQNGFITGSLFGRRSSHSSLTRRRAHPDLILSDSSLVLDVVHNKNKQSPFSCQVVSPNPSRRERLCSMDARVSHVTCVTPAQYPLLCSHPASLRGLFPSWCTSHFAAFDRSLSPNS